MYAYLTNTVLLVEQFLPCSSMCIVYVVKGLFAALCASHTFLTDFKHCPLLEGALGILLLYDSAGMVKLHCPASLSESLWHTRVWLLSTNVMVYFQYIVL